MASSSSSAASSGSGGAPGGLYAGYYREDFVTNPEDPTAGAIYANIPGGDEAFGGEMSFTFLGCQAQSVATLSGQRAGDTISGTWAGSIDGTAQLGAFAGTYADPPGTYTGTYTVQGGKQLITVPGCTQYFIAPQGVFEMLLEGTSTPASFVLSVNGTALTWTNPVGTQVTVVTVIDRQAALAGTAAATRHQQFFFGGTTAFDLATVGSLTAGTEYLVTVAAASISARLAMGSVTLTR